MRSVRKKKREKKEKVNNERRKGKEGPGEWRGNRAGIICVIIGSV